MSPVETRIAAIADKVRRADEVSAGKLVDMLGTASYPMVVLVLSVLNMIPGPPGYGGSIALAIISATVARLLGKPLRLGGWIGRRVLPEKLLERMIGQIQWLAGLIGRLSRPRLFMLTGARTERLTGLFILLVSLPMVVPIPFINAVPNTGTAVICFSRLNRDGLGVIVGGVIALVGLGIAIGAIWAAAMLARSMLAP